MKIEALPSQTTTAQIQDAVVPSQNSQKKTNSVWPVLTVATGILAGSAYNAFVNQSFDIKLGVRCDMMRRLLPLQMINNWKQTEIKGFALASPLIIALCYEGHRYVSSPDVAKSQPEKQPSEVDGIATKENEKIVTKPEVMQPMVSVNHHPLADVAKSVVLTGMMIGMNQAALAYGGEYLPEGFKISGHIMLKGATTYATVKLLNHIEATGSPKLAKLCGGVIAITDSLFLGNTAACYHTVKEVVAGAVIVSASATVIEKTAEPFYTAIKSGLRKAEELLLKYVE